MKKYSLESLKPYLLYVARYKTQQIYVLGARDDEKSIFNYIHRTADIVDWEQENYLVSGNFYRVDASIPFITDELGSDIVKTCLVGVAVSTDKAGEKIRFIPDKAKLIKENIINRKVKRVPASELGGLLEMFAFISSSKENGRIFMSVLDSIIAEHMEAQM